MNNAVNFEGLAKFDAETGENREILDFDVAIRPHPIAGMGLVGEIRSNISTDELLKLSMANRVTVSFGDRKGTAVFPDTKISKFQLRVAEESKS